MKRHQQSLFRRSVPLEMLLALHVAEPLLRRNALVSSFVVERVNIEPRDLQQPALGALFEEIAGAVPERLDAIPLRGGLESAVARVRIEFTAPSGKPSSRSIVLKRLDGHHRREAEIHRLLGELPGAPAVLGTSDIGDSTWLALEYVRPITKWPWTRTENTRLAMRQLARVHELRPSEDRVPGWDYEAELRYGTELTIATVEEHVPLLPEIPLRASLRPLRRFASRLPTARASVEAAFGRGFIHGDAHPGNAILRVRSGKPAAVFIDWARSRVGSPLEDVSSWLQTLRYWEPNAAKRHDSLLKSYLESRGLPMTRELRDAYWVSAGSNVLAGALRFQVTQAAGTTGRAREHAVGQTMEWLRVVRRADACTRA